jgi:hypothetical protein
VHPLDAGLHPPPFPIEIFKTDFVEAMILYILHDFTHRPKLKLADDLYIRILENKIKN